jgi:dimethylargininase
VKVLVRPPSPAFRQALSEHPERKRIDPGRALAQHARFVVELEAAGCEVVRLPPEPELPDAPFVSDTFVPLDGLIVMTRPGAVTRLGEVESVERCLRLLLAPDARIKRIAAPGTLDGGDVIIYARRLAIGVSARTNREGAEQLAALARAAGYDTCLCPVTDRLHLATAVTVLRPDRLVGTPAGFASLDAAGAAPGEVERVVLDEEDLPAANVLPVGGRCLVAAGYPRAAALLCERGEDVVEVELDEFTRADGGPTCLVGLLP